MVIVLWKRLIKVKLSRLRLKNRWHFLLKEVVAFQLTGNAANDNSDGYIKKKKILANGV